MRESNFQSIETVKQAVNRWLLLDDLTVVEVILGAFLANLLEGDPLWLLVNGPPSSAKTELLRALAGHEKTFLLSSLTANTLVSGQATKRGKDPSLLLKLDGKILIMKDFTTVLTMRHETRGEILAQLREIFDGRYNKAFGTGKTIDWRGKVGFISGVTPFIDRCYAVNQMLGERFLVYRLDEDIDPVTVALAAAQKAGQETQMRQELQQAFGGFLSQFDDSWTPNFEADLSLEEKIAALAAFCARGRTGISRSGMTKEIDVLPLAEGPARLVKQLTMLGYDLRMLNGPGGVNSNLNGVYRILRKVGASTLPSIRTKVVRGMYKEGITEQLSSWEKTKVIGELVDLPTTTTTYLLEDLTAIRLVRRRIDIDNKENVASSTPFVFQLSGLCTTLIDKSEIFEP
jgi:hypothetical protein